MLDAVRRAIAEIPDTPFEDLYQEYVRQTQDQIIEHDVNLASTQYISLEDTSELVKGLNSLTEELKTL